MEQSPSWEANRFSDSQNSMHFMEPEGSLLHSQDPTTSSYSEPEKSTPCTPHPTSRIPILILPSHLRLSLSSGLFPLGFPNNALYAPLLSTTRVAFPTHLIRLDILTFIS